MTTERNFERLARAWLEQGPDEAPDRVIADVLNAAETTPQVRRPIGRRPWRYLTLTRLRLGAAIAAVLVVALAGAYLVTRNETVGPAPTSTPGTGPSIPPASVQVTPPLATPTDTPIPAADLVVTKAATFAWTDGALGTQYQLIAEVENRGPGWAQMGSGGQGLTATFKDASGNVTDTRPIFHAVPEFIGPGEKGYLLDGGSWSSVSVADLATVEVALAPSAFHSVTGPAITTDFTNITWRTDPPTPGLIAAGTVLATGKARTYTYVVVLCIGSDGTVLGFTSDTVQNLVPGVPTAFLTTNRTRPLKPAECASSLGLVTEGVSYD